MSSLLPLLSLIDGVSILGTIAVMIGIVLFGFLIFFVRCYKRCPSNRVLVIYGRTGKGAEVLPISVQVL
jgi:flotillin